MKKIHAESNSSTTKRIRPALTPEARQNQLISLAIDLVEKRLIEGTASSQETTHFLKLASTKAHLEEQILEKQKDLIEAKTKSLQSTERIEELYKEAMSAFRRYSGSGESDEVSNIFGIVTASFFRRALSIFTFVWKGWRGYFWL